MPLGGLQHYTIETLRSGEDQGFLLRGAGTGEWRSSATRFSPATGSIPAAPPTVNLMGTRKAREGNRGARHREEV